MESMPDHLHIFLSAPPTVAPTEIVMKLKSITANKVFAAFPNLKKSYFWGSGLWSRGYYIGTAGNITHEGSLLKLSNRRGTPGTRWVGCHPDCERKRTAPGPPDPAPPLAGAASCPEGTMESTAARRGLKV
jgi:hypothetical protein